MAAPIKQCNATLDSAPPGRSTAPYKWVSDLPRCALIKVARYFFIGRSAPSSKEGKTASEESSNTPNIPLVSNQNISLTRVNSSKATE